MKPVSPHQFTIIRFIFSSYLIAHFFSLISWAPEMFSNAGLLPDGKLNPTSGVFPNILIYLDSPIFVQFFIFTLTLLALALMVGYKRRLVSLTLWYGWACLFNRNIFIGNPGLAFVGWILLALALIPSGEPWSKDEFKADWEFPTEIYYGLWAILATGYTISGIHKMGSLSWINGTALQHVLENPLARDNFLREFLVLNPAILKLNTWISLSMEVLFLPLAFFTRTRPFIWLGIVLMHFGIIMVIDFADLTVGVLMAHMFTFDSRWLKPNKKTEPILFFDGVCGLCNGFINFLFTEDSGRVFKVATLQGNTAEKMLSPECRKKLDSLVVFVDGRETIKSDAVLTVFNNIGGIWRLISFFRILPKFIRDAAYDLMASNRYKFFGKKETCRLPTPEERSLFLD